MKTPFIKLNHYILFYTYVLMSVNALYSIYYLSGSYEYALKHIKHFNYLALYEFYSFIIITPFHFLASKSMIRDKKYDDEKNQKPHREALALCFLAYIGLNVLTAFTLGMLERNNLLTGQTEYVFSQKDITDSLYRHIEILVLMGVYVLYCFGNNKKLERSSKC